MEIDYHQYDGQEPYYRPVADDGAQFRCVDCQELFSHTRVLFCATPNGKKSVICDTCLEPDWKAAAKFINDPV